MIMTCTQAFMLYKVLVHFHGNKLWVIHNWVRKIIFVVFSIGKKGKLELASEKL